MIGGIYLDLEIYQAYSLKDKRSVLTSIRNNLKNNFNISISELDFHDIWNRSLLGIVCISKDKIIIDKIFDEIIRKLEEDSRIELLKIERVYY